MKDTSTSQLPPNSLCSSMVSLPPENACLLTCASKTHNDGGSGRPAGAQGLEVEPVTASVRQILTRGRLVGGAPPSGLSGPSEVGSLCTPHSPLTRTESGELEFGANVLKCSQVMSFRKTNTNPLQSNRRPERGSCCQVTRTAPQPGCCHPHYERESEGGTEGGSGGKAGPGRHGGGGAAGRAHLTLALPGADHRLPS